MPHNGKKSNGKKRTGTKASPKTFDIKGEVPTGLPRRTGRSTRREGEVSVRRSRRRA